MKNIKRLTELIETLRGEKGCPWDRDQTPGSIARHLSEEVYELIDAIESDDGDSVCDELGDVLFLLLFTASFYKEAGRFDIEKAAAASAEKMTRRHPHVFGDANPKTPDQIRGQWIRIKNDESRNSGKKYIADSVATKMPPLARARRLSKKAAAAGFDWDDISGAMEKVGEEWGEFCAELLKEDADGDTREKRELEFGDILFTLVNVARLAEIHPETALAASTKKFEKRLTFMEKALHKTGKSIKDVSKEKLNERWEEAKRNEQGKKY